MFPAGPKVLPASRAVLILIALSIDRGMDPHAAQAQPVSMKESLKTCAESLRDVEAKLRNVHDSSHDDVERVRISEALSFLDNAIAAVSHARERVKDFPGVPVS